MNTPTTLIMRAALALALLSCTTTSVAQEKWSLCKPVETVSHVGRVHVRCAIPVDGSFSFFATSTQDARFASRMLNLSMVGQVAEKTLLILFDPGDKTGVTFGCQANDCRIARAIGISEAAAPIAVPAPGPTPTPTPVPSAAREACVAACEVVRAACWATAAAGVPDRSSARECAQDFTVCGNACPP